MTAVGWRDRMAALKVENGRLRNRVADLEAMVRELLTEYVGAAPSEDRRDRARRLLENARGV